MSNDEKMTKRAPGTSEVKRRR